MSMNWDDRIIVQYLLAEIDKAEQLIAYGRKDEAQTALKKAYEKFTDEPLGLGEGV